jgi:hypothetical protein
MWVPKSYRLLGPVFLPRKHTRRQLRLQKIVRNLHMDYAYQEWEITHMLKKYGVHNVKQFFDALLEYGFIEKDIHTPFYYVRKHELSDEELEDLKQRDKKETKWWW